MDQSHLQPGQNHAAMQTGKGIKQTLAACRKVSVSLRFGMGCLTCYRNVDGERKRNSPTRSVTGHGEPMKSCLQGQHIISLSNKEKKKKWIQITGVPP